MLFSLSAAWSDYYLLNTVLRRSSKLNKQLEAIASRLEATAPSLVG